MTENNTQDPRIHRWSVVADSSSNMEAEDWDWDDDDDEILSDTQDSPTQATPVEKDSPTQATPVEKDSSTQATPVDATDVRLVWKWVLTDKAFVARPDPHGEVFHAQIFEDLGLLPRDGVSGTFTLHEWTIRYRAYDLAGGGIDDQTRGRVERELLAWAEQGGPDSAPEAYSADSADADPRDGDSSARDA
jgi:hypothetical protein